MRGDRWLLAAGLVINVVIMLNGWTLIAFAALR